MLFLNISPYSIKILMLLYPIISHVVEHTTWDLRTAPTDPRNEPKWLRNGQLPGVPAAVSAASAPAAGASAAPATLRRVLLRIWQSQSVANATEIWGKSGEISNIQNGAIDGGISIVFLHNIYIHISWDVANLIFFFRNMDTYILWNTAFWGGKHASIPATLMWREGVYRVLPIPIQSPFRWVLFPSEQFHRPTEYGWGNPIFFIPFYPP